MARNKIALIGGGQIGGIQALLAAEKELGDIVVIDIPEVADRVKGKCLDILQGTSHGGKDAKLTATSDFAELEGSDIVIITAGMPRKPGMSREDLLDVNIKIITNVAENVRKYAPNAFCIVVTNPLDAMVYSFYKLTGFPKNRVVGMAGALDTGRFKAFVAMELGVSTKDISALVMGGHGPTMIPLTRTATVGGVPLEELINPDKLAAIVDRTAKAGTEVVKLLGNGSAYNSPAAATLEMAEAYLKDKKRVIASAALCQGEYGIDGLFIGVPVIIGAGGVEKVLEFKLTDAEKDKLAHTIEVVKKTVAETGL